MKLIIRKLVLALLLAAALVVPLLPADTQGQWGGVNCTNCEDACNDEALEFYFNCVNNCGAGEWCQNFCINESYCKKKRCGLRDCESCNWVQVAMEDCPAALESPDEPEEPESTPTPRGRRP